MGGTVFGLHGRERIAFFGKFGDPTLGRSKKELGRSKKTHFRKDIGTMDGANARLDRTGVSGSRFLQ